MTNSLPEIGSLTEAIFIIGSNTAECHPLAARQVLKARDRGAKLIVADPRRTEMAARADIWLRVPVGRNLPVINGMLHVIIRDGLVDASRVGSRASGFEALAEAVSLWTPSRVEELTGVPAADLEAAARAYATAATAAILYGMGVTQFVHGTDSVMALANLAVITGQIGRPGAGLFPLRGQNNVQGACDMGCLPDVLPGYLSVSDPSARRRCRRQWGVEPPAGRGLRATETADAILHGEITALYVFGENPVLSEPDAGRFREALARLELLVVQDIFLTETARLATVVLPAAGAAEKDGTFTNTERRVQRVRAAVPPPGDARPDWRIFTVLAEKMGCASLSYRSAEEIWDEVRRLVPEKFGGISYRRLDSPSGLIWPCPDESHPGTPVLYEGGVFPTPSGKALLHPVPHQASSPGGVVEKPDDDYPLVLTTGRRVYHYHTGTMTRKEWVLNQMGPEELVEINLRDAGRTGVTDGGLVRVSTRRASVAARAWVTERVPPGTVFMTFHFWEACANELTGRARDPVSGVIEAKACAARVERISSVEARAIRRRKKEQYRTDLEPPVNRQTRKEGDGADAQETGRP